MPLMGHVVNAIFHTFIISHPLPQQHLVSTEAVLDVLWCTIARVVLVLTTVVLVVEVLGVVASLALSLLTVDVVGTLGLGETVDLSTCEASEELLGELVLDWLAWHKKCHGQLMLATEKGEVNW